MADTRDNFKVCLVAPFPPRKGGVTVQTALLARYLAEDGIEVLPVDTNLQSLRSRWLAPLRLLLQPWAVLFRLLKNVPKCSVVHFQAASYWGYVPVVIGVPVARLFGKRCVMSYQGGAGPKFMDRVPWLVKMPMRMCGAVAVCSDELRAGFAERGINAHLVKNVFDSALFKYRKRPRVQPKIAWNRSMNDTYDPLSAVKAFEIVKQDYPDATLVMTSDGPLTAAVKEYADQNGLTGVTLTGRVPVQDVARVLDEADICLNTSRIDGLPTSLLEAAACGLPIVSTKAGGIPSLFEDTLSALLVEIGDYQAMASAIIGLLKDPEKASRLGNAARDVAMDYTWERASRKLFQLYGIPESPEENDATRGLPEDAHVEGEMHGSI